MLSKEQINNLFQYKNGKLYWKANHPGRNAKPGQHAGFTAKNGYRTIKIGSKAYKEHRLVWALHSGTFPAGHEIDHINRMRDDNRIENLRMVTRSINGRNKKDQLCAPTLSGVHGVKYDARWNKWGVRVATTTGVRKSCGYYTCLEDAITARNAIARLFGYIVPTSGSSRLTR